MPSVSEAAATQATSFSAAAKTGEDVLSLWQTIIFTRYVRLVLPIDGSIFWVRADQVSTSALANAMGVNVDVLNANPALIKEAATLTVKGSLHYSTDTQQDESETYGLAKVVFTAQSEVKPLRALGPDEIFIGTFQGNRFSFSSRGPFYIQADLFHYVGDAVYPFMETQLVDDVIAFSTTAQVVSNSLPIWLSMSNYEPQPWEAFGVNFPLYPSFLSPANLQPPYATVHIDPDSTEAIASAPTFSSDCTHDQITQEHVRVTLYGLRNASALDFADFVGQFTRSNPSTMGIMNMPIIKDEKRTQTELTTIAMKKTIEFDVNYYQHRANNIARQLIESAIPTFYVNA